MASVIDYITQGSRIFTTSLKTRFKYKEYEGGAIEICENIVKDCWNGHFFQTSTTNFPQFWTRDFGWCTQSLLKLGYEKEVMQTIRYAMNRFIEFGSVTTTIRPGGKPFDFPYMAVDSLAWFIHTIKISKFGYYDYRHFLNKQIMDFFEKVVDKDTGLVVRDKKFSSIKDLSIRESSCYDNCMVAMLSKDLKDMKLVNPFEKYNYPKLIKETFWNGEFFFDDLQELNYVAGDANLFPIVLGIVKDKEIIEKAIKAIEENELDKPIPLCYTKERENANFTWEEKMLKNYEGNVVWTHMGPLYIKLLLHIDSKKKKAHEHIAKYKELIEHHKTFPEVVNKDGSLFKTPFYFCDTGMLWACNFISLTK